MRSLVLLLVLALPTILAAQGTPADQAAERRDKLETIMRIQDLRTQHDGVLLQYLSDHDPVVRERATFAYGSIQDTTALTPLIANLTDGPASLQSTAAWAIGQTAPALGLRSRQVLEHDLIWARLDQMKNPDRLIEEIGKFGTEQGLGDILSRFGGTSEHSSAVIMSLARFGIRGISSTDGVRYLMKFLKPADNAPWQAAYALQRIGSHDETRAQLEWIVPLFLHHDARVRMNIATLFGKLKDAKRTMDALVKLAERDGDWRVRVNALKALGNFTPEDNPDLPDLFRRAFLSDNTHIAVTALSTIGGMGIRADRPGAAETFAALARIAENPGDGYLWQLQAEAALSLAKLLGPKALASIKPAATSNIPLKARLLSAVGSTGSADAADVLLPFVNDEDPLLARSALEGLQELSRRRHADSVLVGATYGAAVASLQKKDVALATTAASILGDSLFLRKSAVGPLLTALSAARIPDDVEAMQEIISTLGKIGDDRAVKVLREQLSVRDQSVAAAAASALAAITGRSYTREIDREYEPPYVDLDFEYLRALPDTVKVKLETIRGDVFMELYKNVAPFTVMSFLKLATQRGFYRGLSFHRVVPNFVVQGGDPRGDGWGGAGYAIRSEFSPLRYEVGTMGIASAGKDTEGSQFFITQSPQPHLDGRYTIFGKVTRGMEIVDKILVGDHMFDIVVVR